MVFSYKIKCHCDNNKNMISHINKEYEVSCFIRMYVRYVNIYTLIKTGLDLSKFFIRLGHFHLKAYCQNTHQLSFQDRPCLNPDIV